MSRLCSIWKCNSVTQTVRVIPSNQVLDLVQQMHDVQKKDTHVIAFTFLINLCSRLERKFRTISVQDRNQIIYDCRWIIKQISQTSQLSDAEFVYAFSEVDVAIVNYWRDTSKSSVERKRLHVIIMARLDEVNDAGKIIADELY
jgi:hypothetical protein